MESGIVNGVRIYAPRSRSELIEYAVTRKGILVAANAEKILHATEDTRSIFNSNIGYPDGVGAVLALKRCGLARVTKVPGCELWLDIVAACVPAKTFYLVGGRDSVISEVVRKLRDEFPGIRILGFRNGFFGDDGERAALIADVVKKRPDVVFVAMGSPRQEALMGQMLAEHAAVYQGLGGSFDVYTGRVKRAPEAWVRLNLEWLYRLLQEPTRIGRQRHLLTFLFRLYSGRFGVAGRG